MKSIVLGWEANLNDRVEDVRYWSGESAEDVKARGGRGREEEETNFHHLVNVENAETMTFAY